MAILVGYMFVNFQSTSILSGVTSGGKTSALAMIEKFAPLSWLTHFVLDGGTLAGIFSLLMLLVPFCLGIWLYASAFGRPKSGYRSSSRILAFSARSPRKALLDKEVKHYMACSIYVFNTAFGPLILIVFAIVIAVLGPDKIISAMGIPAADIGMISKDLTYVILAGAFCLFPSMTSTTASSISLEGKQLWILKAHPVSTDDVFWSKYMLNILLLVPASVFASILIGVRVQMPPVQIAGFAAVIGLLGVLVSLIGLIANLLFPRFDWDNETSVVKQSMSVIMAMIFGFAAACIPFVLYFIFLQKFGFLGFCAVGILVYGALCAGSYFFLTTTGKKLFEAL
jgi:ABC-2 type transport system permease protein